MSETIIGYINLIGENELIFLEGFIREKTVFGFKFEDKLSLFNYPTDLLLRNDIVQFVISDSNTLNTATILLNEQDYDLSDDSESLFQKKFPALLSDRILEVAKIIKSLLSCKMVLELGVSFSSCDEIEQIKRVSVGSFESLIVSDCMRDCPPNVLYIIDK